MKFVSMIDVPLDTLYIGQSMYNSVPQLVGEIVDIHPDSIDVKSGGWIVQYPLIREHVSHLYVEIDKIENESIFIKLEKMIEQVMGA